MASLTPAEDEEDGELYYDEDEALAGADADARAAMLDRFDSLLQRPPDANLDEVSAEVSGASLGPGKAQASRCAANIMHSAIHRQ